MEVAGHVVWRRCAGHWRARTRCSAVHGAALPPSLCSKASSPCSPLPVTQRAPMSLCSAVTQRAPMSLCSVVTQRAPMSLCSAVTQRARMSLCSAVTQRAPMSQCSAVTQRAPMSLCSAVTQRAPMSLCSAVTQRAPMSLCSAVTPMSSAVSQPSTASLCSILGTAAFTSHPLRNLCAAPGGTLCWSCQSVVSSSQLFCPSCSSIQPPDDSQDFFQLLNCERSFNIDVLELQRKYRNLQRLLHPDYFSQKSQHERNISEKQSSLVNKAYNTLLSPLRRGVYLLSLHGITMTEGTEGGVDEPFLFEILQINEQLDDMSAEEEMKEIEEIGTYVQDMCQSLTENIQIAFEKGDLDDAKMFLTKMKYYSNILDQVKKKMVP